MIRDFYCLGHASIRNCQFFRSTTDLFPYSCLVFFIFLTLQKKKKKKHVRKWKHTRFYIYYNSTIIITNKKSSQICRTPFGLGLNDQRSFQGTLEKLKQWWHMVSMATVIGSAWNQASSPMKWKKWVDWDLSLLFFIPAPVMNVTSTCKASTSH